MSRSRTYRLHAGYLDSVLRARGDLDNHASVTAAVAALLAVSTLDADDVALVPGDGHDNPVFVYRNATDARDDEDGSHAFAVITRSN